MDQVYPFFLLSQTLQIVGAGLLYDTQSLPPLTSLKPFKADAYLRPILCKNSNKLIRTWFTIVLEKSRP